MSTKKTIRMKKADLDKWLAALRGGEYEQGRNSLHCEGKYCCLGVLQHCLTGEVERGRGLPSAPWLRERGIVFLASYGPVSSPTVIFDGEEIGIDSYNDGSEKESRFNLPYVRPHSFAEIADIIEQIAETY